MIELLLIVGSYLGYRYAVGRGWMQPLPLLGGSSTVVVAEIETYMPDPTRATILAALGTSSDPAALSQMASFYATYYPAAAYSLQLRAWQLSGSKGAAPQPPSAATMTAAQVAWAASNSTTGA